MNLDKIAEARRASFYAGSELDARPAYLPPQWRLVDRGGDGAAYKRVDGLAVIASASLQQDGKRWLHVSLSRANRLPSYEDLAHVKRVFVGEDRFAVQVFAPKAQHVNLHAYCLHLWCCLDGHPLPDFSQGTGSV